MMLMTSKKRTLFELEYAVGSPTVWCSHERSYPPPIEFEFNFYVDSYEDDSLQMQVFPNVGEYAGKSLCSSPTKTT